MKQFFKKIITAVITFEAKLVLKKHKPKIVAITGSVGKTSAKDAIAAVLGAKFEIRKSDKSFNSEIGVPLVVLGCDNAWDNPFLWLLNILKGLRLVLFPSKYPEWLVLEMGVDRPGDMEALTSWIKPTIAVITTLAEIPVHVEYFPSPEAVAREKAKILRHLSAENFAVLNMDDAAVYAMREKTRAKITTYGFAESADISGSNYKIMTRDEGDFRIPEGITFKVDHKGSSVPVRIFGSLGRHHVYPALAASAVGIAVGMNFVDISEALARYVSPPGRMKPVRGIKNTLILDDTYNSSPMAVRAALEVLAEIPANRKIAVLGDMLELGKYTIEAHRGLASVLKKTADFVISVGPRAKFITTELREKGFAKKRLFEFSTSDEVKTAIQDILEEGDLVLVKGSQGMRMEKIVEEIMAEPQKACELLVRQEKRWRCKK